MKPDELSRFGTICVGYAEQMARLQLFAEVARLGREYVVNALPLVDKPDKELVKQILTYAKTQQPVFHDLLAHVLVRLHGLLDAFVADAVLFMIEHQTQRIEGTRAGRLTGPIVAFVVLDPAERADRLYEMLLNDLGGADTAGVGRYESVLEAVGLKGPVAPAVRKLLYTTSKLRNCIVHRNGVVDRRLANDIPDLQASLGMRLALEASLARACLFATMWYFLEVQRRVLPDTTERIETLIAERDSFLTKIESGEVATLGFPFAP